MTRSLRIRSKFLLLIVLLVPAMLAITLVGLEGLSTMRQKVDSITGNNLHVAQLTAQLSSDISHTGELALHSIIVSNPRTQGRLDTELSQQAEPAVNADLSVLSALDATDQFKRGELRSVIARWHRFLALTHTGIFNFTGSHLLRVDQAAAGRAAALLSGMELPAAALVRSEVHDAGVARAHALSTQRTYQDLMIAISVAALLAMLAFIAWLIRNVVPRITAYSAFAGRVANGDLGGRIPVRGSDEITDLGSALNRMVEQAGANGDADAWQREFAEAMQLTESEDEAQGLLRRHLQRVAPGSDPIVLVRNNSDDRLQAAAGVEHDADLAARLVDARPRSCLAVRFAQSQQQGDRLDPLLECEVCGKRPGFSVCDPLIVHGEVIGSVLLTSPDCIEDTVKARLVESVSQASPVLGNLRTLALAERRAATDILTGLPNTRAAQDTLRRMSAQASRSVSPLAAALLDLDNFKQINDLHGHPKADEVLALVGATLSASVRESDFVARYGGEEFLILMPGTDGDAAMIVGNKIREAIGDLVFPDLGQLVTTSVGVAAFPEDASDPGTLVRHADHALYVAKRGGRNRVERFTIDSAVGVTTD